jgi:hypothetical protein
VRFCVLRVVILNISFLWRDSASVGHFRIFVFDIYMLCSVFYVVCVYEGCILTFTSTLKRKSMECVSVNILYLTTQIKSNCVRRSGVRIPAGQRFFSLLQKSNILFSVCRNFFSEVKRRRGLMLSAQFLQLPRLRISGVIPIRFLYAFMAVTVTTSLLISLFRLNFCDRRYLPK